MAEIRRDFVVKERIPEDGLEVASHTLVWLAFTSIGDDSVTAVRKEQDLENQNRPPTFAIEVTEYESPSGSKTTGAAIAEETHTVLFEATEGKRLLKAETVLAWEGLNMQVDTYRSHLGGLVIARVDSTEGEDSGIVKPGWLGDEITGIEWLRDSRLAIAEQAPFGELTPSDGPVIQVPRIDNVYAQSA